MKTHNQDKKGFTIIEVVLVLAIAGLIFLIVFLAVPALQRSQRDTQRRSDMGRFLSQVTQFQSNTGGQVPSDFTGSDGFIETYMKAGGDTFVDPSGNAYTVDERTGTGGTDASNDLGVIYYFQNAVCAGGGVEDGNGSRDIAITLKLEGGGTFCQDNGS